MPISPEEADAALNRAIHDAAEAGGWIGEGEMLTTWAIIAAFQRADTDTTSYVILGPGGSMPAHTVAGLFALGQHLSVVAYEKDDD